MLQVYSTKRHTQHVNTSLGLYYILYTYIFKIFESEALFNISTSQKQYNQNIYDLTIGVKKTNHIQ